MVVWKELGPLEYKGKILFNSRGPRKNAVKAFAFEEYQEQLSWSVGESRG